jgi:MFS family permease
MALTSTADHRTSTLLLCAILHAFTHLYQVALIPLYLLVQRDFELSSVQSATFFVTLMGIAYFVPSYPMGVMADRFSRKRLLGIGLLINSLGFIGLASAPSYGWALACIVLSGFGGSFYHPAATALVARLFPVGTGRALGFLGMGASLGFFVGPIYSGWRAEISGSWRTPVLELGLVGLIAGLLFLLVAREQPASEARAKLHHVRERLFATPQMWMFFFLACLAFSLRDFGGSGMGTLSSLFLQKARDFSPGLAGLALSAIFLASAFSNPIFGSLSDRGRMRWISFVLIMAALFIVLFPRVSHDWTFPTLALYGFFFLSNFPMVEAALMQSVPDSVRGRVFGLFITVGGLLGNLGHWAGGTWVKQLGPAASVPEEYFGLFAVLALMVCASVLGLPCLAALRHREMHASVLAPASPTAAARIESA